MRYFLASLLALAALLGPLAAMAQEAGEFEGEHNGFRYLAFRLDGATLLGTVVNDADEPVLAVLADITVTTEGQVVWKKFVYLGDMNPGAQVVVSEPYETRAPAENITVRLYANAAPLQSKNSGFALAGEEWAMTEPFNLEAGPTRFMFQYEGEGTFSVTLLSSDNSFLGTLIEAEGSGTANKDWDIDITHPCKLEINAEGPWRIAVMDPDNPVDFSGGTLNNTRIEVQEEDGVLLFSNY